MTTFEYGGIRHFDPLDIDDVMEICSTSLSETYSKSVVYEIFLTWHEGFFVFTSGNKVIGFLAGSRKTIHDARVLLLATREKYRNLGIGFELMNKFEEKCRYSGILSVRLEVRTDNVLGIKFYKRLGYSITSTLQSYYSDGSDAYVMWKPLF
ncbi:MAG: ribosomal protein S18-alanine N-acetyltransferase [Thermoplasmataceae archaeon]